MTSLTGMIVLLSAFAMGGLAQSSSNAQTTETLAPSLLGTTTSNGALFVSMNYCSVIINTQCQISVMTSAAAPPAASTAPSVETTSSAYVSGPLPTSPSVSTSAAVASSTETSQSTNKPSSSYGSEVTAPASTASQSSGAGSPAVTTSSFTAGAAGTKAFRGAAWGVAILAVAALI
ncbi:hypothetical protein E4U14_002473 [Claviceps sp. LM454 group G7]|nr:hypothetical protein E4U14_002473 [Claviceps sp. LM454 group G7]